MIVDSNVPLGDKYLPVAPSRSPHDIATVPPKFCFMSTFEPRLLSSGVGISSSDDSRKGMWSPPREEVDFTSSEFREMIGENS